MKRKLLLLAGFAALSLTGCATRGPLTLECERFGDYHAPIPRPPIIESIVSDANDPGGITIDASQLTSIYSDDAVGTFVKKMAPNLGLSFSTSNATLTDFGAADSPVTISGDILMLSGGGHWGAYGAGFLRAMHQKDADQFPKFEMVTGVSTGSLQSLFIAAAQSTGNYSYWLSELQQQYSPEKENEIVNRGGFFDALTKGSLAGLKPLRHRIETALCENLETASCSLIDALVPEKNTNMPPLVLVGFVHAKSGEIMMAPLNVIAMQELEREGRSEIENYRSAQQCLTSVLMASSAVPFQFQQVKVAAQAEENNDEENDTSLRSEAYLDGGVRQSVFIPFVEKFHKISSNANLFLSDIEESKIEEDSTTSGNKITIDDQRNIYVLRNGPTTVRPDSSPNKKADALTAALRSYSIIVNEVEVSSIAAIRLQHPTGNLFLTTADGYAGTPTDSNKEDNDLVQQSDLPNCRREHEAVGKRMFDPTFMKCLIKFGTAKGYRSNSSRWIKVAPIEFPKKPEAGDLKKCRGVDNATCSETTDTEGTRP